MEKFDISFTNCLICGSSDIFQYHQASKELKIFKCRNCKIQFLNPQYSDEYLSEMYSRYIVDQSDIDDEIYQSHLDCLLMIEKYKTSNGKLFDIGSGNGHLISLAKKRNWIPIGYDIDCKTVKRISNKIGVEMFCGDFKNLNFQKERFDVVTMLHVIEHLKNPISYLKIIREILKSDGVFFLALPNIQSRSALLKLFLEKVKIRRRNIAAYYDTGHHLWYYTPKTIRYALQNNGFDVKIIYSGRSSSFKLSRVRQTVSEKILAKLIWTSNMIVLAVKK